MAHRKAHGRDMSPRQLQDLSKEEEGSSYSAAMVVVLGMSSGQDGWPAKLSDEEAVIPVWNVDLRVALRMHGRRKIRAELTGPYRPWE